MMQWLKGLRYAAYLSYLIEIAALLAIPRTKDQLDGLAEALSDVLFRAVDHATKGLASSAIDGEQLARVVGDVVDVFEPVIPCEETPPA